MFAFTFHKVTTMKQLLPLALCAASCLTMGLAQAAAPGITGTPVAGTFYLTAGPAFLTEPDGQSVYSWGYGCKATSSAIFAPAMANATPTCGTMQVPGPTLIVTEGVPVSVTLTNNLPPAAGNTSILFPGFNVTTSCPASTTAGAPQQGLLTCEAAPGASVTYTFTPGSPGTRAYYSGTQGDLQVEMGLYGAIIVLPANVPANCKKGLPATNQGGNAVAQLAWGESDFRLAASAYDHPDTCYDREYLFQFSEMDPNIHAQALAQVQSGATSLLVPTEPY